MALEPDLGVALTYFPIMVIALWLGGLPTSVGRAAIVGVVAAVVFWQTALKPYQKERVLTVLDPDRDPYGSGYQVQQSKIAVGSGGLVGQGLGQGSQSLLRLPSGPAHRFRFRGVGGGHGFRRCHGIAAELRPAVATGSAQPRSVPRTGRG